MKSELQPGLSTTRRIMVDTPRTIGFLGEDLRVYATPRLIHDWEIACREFLLQYADAGEESVGTAVNIIHSGAAPLGTWVDISLTVAEVSGRHVTFELVARDAMEEIGRGRHSRFVIEVEKLRERIVAKAERIAARNIEKSGSVAPM